MHACSSLLGLVEAVMVIVVSHHPWPMQKKMSRQKCEQFLNTVIAANSAFAGIGLHGQDSRWQSFAKGPSGPEVRVWSLQLCWHWLHTLALGNAVFARRCGKSFRIFWAGILIFKQILRSTFRTKQFHRFPARLPFASRKCRIGILHCRESVNQWLSVIWFM